MNFLPPSRILGAAVSCCLLLPATAFGAQGEQTPLDLGGSAAKATAEQAGPSGGSMVRTIVGLAVVLGVIFGLHWVLKQVKAAKRPDESGAGLASVATLPLGTNRSLHLVRVGTELVLVGAGEHGVTPIRTYTPAEALAAGLVPEAVEDVIEGAAHAPAGADAPRGLVARMLAPSFEPSADAPVLRAPGTALAARPAPANPVARLVDDLRARTVIRK